MFNSGGYNGEDVDTSPKLLKLSLEVEELKNVHEEYQGATEIRNFATDERLLILLDVQADTTTTICTYLYEQLREKGVLEVDIQKKSSNTHYSLMKQLHSSNEQLEVLQEVILLKSALKYPKSLKEKYV